MKYFYDFHIHSALSPCGDDENTPANIVNMAKLKKLDVIALSDHNTVQNCRVAMYHGEKAGVLVLPAMELNTAEEIHILCLFKSIEGAEEFEKYIRKDMLKIKNKPKIFGNQFLFDKNDNIIGIEENLLWVASKIPSYLIYNLIKDFEGIAVPAHIDRESNGILSVLGEINKNMNFTTLEINSGNQKMINNYKKNYKIITDSDAHYLGNINERINSLELDCLKPENIINSLK